ncbi:exonuclease SbcCD subunit D C-terminal domain-containing protein [Xanthovirga aplysinae]|uniref:exonuclease SbcCD subunit D C-terminal domain-containing protein n=1 Tax=Xanthovirga aplysinae TaxID=2529853 RepID=UPI0012BC5711|nr:exonuclease SbcCD subunit D C-terminal domain-containing protein [Xanthovirga aplysinae]MTI32297.1 exonuclease subunit SbcD [Xanthovirga aplysinae]
MRILHTSDWHIGKKLLGFDLAMDHKLFFGWLIETIRKQKVDVLVVAGDIFDQANPSKTSESAYYKFLIDLHQTSCKHVIITGGNHDGIGTLDAPKEVLKILNVTTISSATENVEDEIIEIRNQQEELELVVCAIPFLRDKEIRQAVAGESYDDKIQQTREGILRHYQVLGEICEKRYSQETPIMATGHLFAQGVSNESDSVRDIHIGNQAAINASGFHGRFDYVALGHIHRPQKLSAPMLVRYSGSPIPLSFTEKNYEHSVVLLETTPDRERLLTTTIISVPVFRKLISIKGNMEEICHQLNKIKRLGELPTLVEVNVEEDEYNPGLLLELEQLTDEFQQKAEENQFQIVKKKIYFRKKTQGADELFTDLIDMEEMTAENIFLKRLSQEEIPETVSLDLQLAFKEIMETIPNK